MNHQTNWMWGLVALGAGLLLSVLFVLLSRRGAGAAPNPDERLVDLEQRYQMLIAQLRELESDKHQHSEEKYRAERSRLELAAAQVLREKDQHLRGVQHEQQKATARAERMAKAKAADDSFLGRNPALKGALWGGATVLFFVILGVLLGQESKSRQDGDEMTGGVGRTMQNPSESAQQEDPSFQAALNRLGSDPDNIELLAEVSHELIRRQQFEDAQRLVNHATGIDPFHVETRIHRALLSAAEGNGPQGMRQLEHLANHYPQAHEALLYAGALSLQIGNRAAALKHFERYVAEAPLDEQPEGMSQAVSQLRHELQQAPTKP